MIKLKVDLLGQTYRKAYLYEKIQKREFFLLILDCVYFEKDRGLKTDPFFARSIITLLSFLQITKLHSVTRIYSNIRIFHTEY